MTEVINRVYKANYRIKYALRKADNGECLQIYGLVKNLSNFSWDSQYNIGLRNFRDKDGNNIENIEFRGKINKNYVGINEEANYHFTVPFNELPINLSSFEIDMVKETRFWFGEVSAKPTVVQIDDVISAAISNFFDERLSWRLEIFETRSILSEEAKKKIDIIGEALHLYDFRTYKEISIVRNVILGVAENKAFRLPIPTSKDIFNACSDKITQRFSNPFLKKIAIDNKIKNYDENDPSTIIELFKCVVQDGQRFSRNSCISLPHVFCEWLNQRGLPKYIAFTPATRAMMALFNKDQNLRANPSDGGYEMFWWFATSVLIDCNITSSMIPLVMRDKLSLSANIEGVDYIFPGLTGFMSRLHQEDDNYKRRYDVSVDTGRLAYAFDLLLLSLENEARRALIGKDILNWMINPIDKKIPISPFELLLLANMGICDSKDLRNINSKIYTYANIIRTYYGWLQRPSAKHKKNSIRVLGDYRSSTGLSVNMKMSVDTIASIGYDVEVVDAGKDLCHYVITQEISKKIQNRNIDLFHLNLDAIPSLVSRYSNPERTDVYRIGFALWETSVMPEEHRPGLELLDEIWVPTSYVAEIYRDAGFENIHVMGKGIKLPEVEKFNLQSIGIGKGDFTFLTSFDIGSWVERKNPIAAIEAFKLAYPDDPTAKIVVKTTGLFDHDGDKTRQIERIIMASENDNRIILYNENLDFGKYLGLIASCNAVVSSHRSEGFGYLPAYAMLLGVPVISTNYSGNVDFCTDETSFPVDADIVEIGDGDFVYDARGAKWADINVEELSKTMLRVRNEPIEAMRRVKKASKFVKNAYSNQSLASRYAARLEEITKF